MSKIRVTRDNSRIYKRSGVYLGGIGAGGVEFLPTGRFGLSHMSNQYHDEVPFEAFFLFQKDGRAGILSTEELIHESRTVGGVESLTFDGAFPRLRLECEETGTVIELQSYCIPGDLDNSTLPLIKITIDSEADVTFCLKTDGPARVEEDGPLLNHISDDGELAIHRTDTTAPFFSNYNFRYFLRNYVNFTHDDALKVAGPSNDHFIRHGGVHFVKPRKQVFFLAWHYPDMQDLAGEVMGRYYENRFANVREVIDHAVAHRDTLDEATDAFCASVYGDEIDDAISYGYGAQLSSLVKESWLDKQGRFGVWEGSPCSCGLQTTDVAHYGSWLYLNAFPELERSAIDLTAAFQSEDGYIAHNFPRGFDAIDHYGRKDCSIQYILMAYRDYVAFDDPEFLAQHWPHMLKACEVGRELDQDGDGVPDIVGTEQTFDVWSWKGCSVYMASLWAGALQCMAAAARVMGDDDTAAKAEKAMERALVTMDEKLWNGEYYILWRHGDECDEACLADGLSGDWYSRLCGLGGILPDDRVVSHLKACHRLNRVQSDPSYMKVMTVPDEEGMCLINGGYESGRTDCFHQYEPWTGMEYAFAIHCLLMGLDEEAMTVVRDVHERKLRAGMVWNHMECGGHYFRPMVFGKLFELVSARG